MAWAEARRLQDGRSAWYGRWIDPATGERKEEKLGVIPEHAARAWAKQASIDLEGRKPKASELAPRIARARFLAHLRLEGKRPATVRFYSARLTETMDALEAMASMPRWTPEHFKAFLRAHPKWAPRRIQMHLSTSRRFLRFAEEQRIQVGRFTEGVKGPRVRVTDTPHYTDQEFARLLEVVRGKPIEVPVALGGLAGFSFGDMTALDRGEVHLKEGWIRRLRAKTGEQIRVPIYPQLREVLERRMPKRGRVCIGLAKDEANARRALRSALRQADLESGGWHRLRHTFGSMLAAAGVDLPTIRLLMGHAPGSTQTLRYLHSDEERAQKAVAKLSVVLKRAAG